ncbi:MAG TPA: VWA domain-containing protein [Bryobacteraceae bacterium]|nr:VWA domain-containing protein [Bryobacteraceae bacterium]
MERCRDLAHPLLSNVQKPILYRLALAGMLSCALFPPGFGQQNPAPSSPPQSEEPTIKVQVDLVNILFSVHNKKSNGLIGNLSKDNFTIFEDGKQQDIRYFARENDLPLTLGLLIDVSRSQENLIGIEQNAASQFFQQVIRPKDLAFVISFGSEADLLQDYTSSHQLLESALHGLRVSSDVGGITAGPVPTASHPRGTILYDAVYLAADQQLRGQVGRKVLVLITDGDDQGSRYRIDQAIEAAQRADAIIYSIYYVDRGFYMQSGAGGFSFGGSGEGYLKRMSEETGGRVFKVDRKHTLQDAFDQLQEEVRSQYAIAYAPSNSAKDGTFRHIEVKVDNKDYRVQARKGYYASPAGN